MLDLEERSGEAGRPGGGCGRGAMKPAAVAPPGGWWRRPVGPGWGGGDDGHGGGAAPGEVGGAPRRARKGLGRGDSAGRGRQRSRGGCAGLR